ncbi:hypothetical protein FE634_04725 [Nocardioides dongxiaopingii]|uniref:M15 family metallopeptidase n=1 Tax=Nocardioides sp. S-1144 TaxID=2582905 RepID=UPI00110E3A15|nr:M15 family metallopeptidase [Nocardioides sp. S-1144]QCW49894.1 hypothetical protein FE634_04725 [Nocardioides sp. S-1144]
MAFGRLLVIVSLLLLGATLPAAAAEPASLVLTATAGPADADAPLAVTLTGDDGAPLAGAAVVLERRRDGAWAAVATVVTDTSGRGTAVVRRARDAGDNVFRARYDGDGVHDPARTAPVPSRLVRQPSVVTVGGRDRVVDERAVTLRVRWRTTAGTGVPGPVRLQRRLAGERWETLRTLRTDGRGRATLRVWPRVDSRWRVVAPALDWVRGDRSPVHGVDNLPPGVPVRLPAAAPEPRVDLPRQPRATSPGADPVVTAIPDGVWDDMTGRSWHEGCPVGRSGLRLLRINYWGYDGYRYRGELVAAAGAVDNMARALAAMYAGRYPIRSMVRVDRFGWSERVQGADDHRSMAAGNTSAFNCRWVVNRPGVRSPHSYGRSLDVNTWENPYRSATGLVPNSWWQAHRHPRVAWRSRDHGVVRIMLRHGFRWTYGTGDSQHFDVPSGSGRVVGPAPRACGGHACH